MGWCHEFGPQIKAGCDAPMVAGADRCTCAACGVECTGRFGGCSAVWARGPVAVTSVPAMLDAAFAPADLTLDTATEADAALAPSPPVRFADLSEHGEPEPAPPVVASPGAAPRRRPSAPSRPRTAWSRTEAPAGLSGLDALRARLDGLRHNVLDLGDDLGRQQ